MNFRRWAVVYLDEQLVVQHDEERRFFTRRGAEKHREAKHRRSWLNHVVDSTPHKDYLVIKRPI
jgi:hypothetical protein